MSGFMMKLPERAACQYKHVVAAVVYDMAACNEYSQSIVEDYYIRMRIMIMMDSEKKQFIKELKKKFQEYSQS